MTAPGSDDKRAEEPRTSGAQPAIHQRVSRWEVRGAGCGYGVYGDERLLQTPAGRDLVVPSRRLAEAIAAEFRAQKGARTLDYAVMPNLRLAATTIDRVTLAHDATVDAVAAYGATELLCYRAEHPGDLVERQHAAWQPLLDWVASRFQAPLCNTAGVMPRAQSPATLAALRAAIAAYDHFLLAALAFAVQTSGSLVVGLAMVEGRLTAAEAFAMAELDESYQIEQWGEDAEAARRRATRRRDLEDVAGFLALLRNDDAVADT